MIEGSNPSTIKILSLIDRILLFHSKDMGLIPIGFIIFLKLFMLKIKFSKRNRTYSNLVLIKKEKLNYFFENLGFFIKKKDKNIFFINKERIIYWLKNGAIPSISVYKQLKEFRLLN